MARERLLDLDWSLENISFDLFALTAGAAPGDVSWSEPGPDQAGLAEQAVHRFLAPTTLKVKKKRRSVEELILRRDEDLVGVARAEDQVLLVGRALPMMSEHARSAVSVAMRRGFEYWSLSFYDVLDGVIIRRRGAGGARQVEMLGDADSFVASGAPLAFEAPIWDGTTSPYLEEGRGCADEEHDDDQPVLEERLARACLVEWLAGGAGGTQLLDTKVTVLEFQR